MLKRLAENSIKRRICLFRYLSTIPAMRSATKLGVPLALIFLLPALFFTVYELSSLDKDEEMIQEIYNKQLEAILFSVNQYADDIVTSWITKVETGWNQPLPADSVPPQIHDLLNLNSSLSGAYIIDTIDQKAFVRVFRLQNRPVSRFHPGVDTALQKSIPQFLAYKKSGFQKLIWVAPFDSTMQPSLGFITEVGAGRYRLAGLFIDPALFIEEVIGPRMQAVARDQFILSVLREGEDSIVYSTAPPVANESVAEAVTKNFWLFPDYQVGIRTKGTTLQQLVRERTATNLLLLVVLNVALLIAVFLVFRNLRREVDLAQNKADFVSNVSHEIRTPLALISMFAETLELDRVPSAEKRKEYYKIISKEAQRLSGIVNKILNFSQTEAGKRKLRRESFHLDTEIKQILATYDFHLSNKGFSYEFEGHDDVWVRGDKQALFESVVNLIDNAMKYSEDKKHIRIKSGRSGDVAFVSVQDHGVGISRKDQKHIFDKFYRVSSGNLARSPGTGLGLSLVRQLMEDQGGSISVHSELGKGSTFTLFFPLEHYTSKTNGNHTGR